MTYGYFTADISTGVTCAHSTGLRRAALQAFSGTDIRFLRRTPSSFRRSTIPSSEPTGSDTACLSAEHGKQNSTNKSNS